MTDKDPDARPSTKSDRVNEESQSEKNDPVVRDGVTNTILAGYSMGHFANDLCASMWFIYLSYYLLNVVDLTSDIAGLCLLSGQITDGITTPIVGYFSDKLDNKCGKRNIWYYLGSVLVVPSFLCIFMNPEFFTGGGKNTWYIIWPAIFNIGWASVQIAHMSIVNQLSYSQRKRDKMVVYRNGFTYIANIFVLALSMALFYFIASSTTQFQILGLTCIGIGMCSTTFYVCTVREVPLSKMALEYEARYQEAIGRAPTTE